MKNIQERVQKMIDGEHKRREIAEKFIDFAGDILQDYAEGVCTVCLSSTENVIHIGKGLYYRYHLWRGDRDYEDTGFYFDYSGYYVWGEALTNMKGKQFWNGISVILDFLKQLPERMDIVEQKRNAIISDIQVYLESRGE